MSGATSIGEQLRSARQRAGLELSQAAERLRVDESVLESIETGSFKTLGAPVFVRGHLRRYAELVGESEESVQARYAALDESGIHPDLTAVPHMSARPAQAPRRRWPLVVLAVVLMVAAVAWWAMGVKTA